MTTPGPRFFSHPRGTVYSNIPSVFTVNVFPANGLFYARPYAGARLDSTYIKTVFIVAGVTIVAVEPHANALACNILSLGDGVCYGGKSEPFKTQAFLDISSFISLSGSRRGTIESSIGENPVFELTDLPATLELVDSCEGIPEPTVDASELFLGDESSTDVPVAVSGTPPSGNSLDSGLKANPDTHGSPTLGNSVGQTTSDEGRSSLIARNSEGGSSGYDNSRAPTPPSPPSTVDGPQDRVDTGIDHDSSSPRVVGEGAPPLPPSSNTSGNPSDNRRTTLIDWKYMMIALAVFVGLKQVSGGTFKRSSSTANRGQKKKLSNNKIKPTEPLENTAVGASLEPDAGVVPTEMLSQNIAGYSLEWTSSPSPTLPQGDVPAFVGQLESAPQPMPCEMNISGLFVNPTIDADMLSTVNLHSESSQECAQNIACGLLLMILLVYLGSCLAILAVRLSQKMVNNIIESSLDNNAYEQIQNAVPGTLLLDTVASEDIGEPLRNTLPLGCVFLTTSGPCTIDPRPTRQITLKEEKQTFGLPVESLALPPSPSSLSPPSCLVGTSRPESPKGPRTVTFLEENEVFILPLNTATRDRNLRRRLSRRAMAAAGGTVSVASVAKRR